MNLSKLFEMQRALDEKIIEKKELHGQDLLPQKILALQVELGELANEWRGFKVWSNDRSPRNKVEELCPYCDGQGGAEDSISGDAVICDHCKGEPVIAVRNPLLEEYVDCLHFILSIGNDCRKSHITIYYHSLFGKFGIREGEWDKGSVIEQFRDIFDMTGKLESSYTSLMLMFLDLGFMLGFNWSQVEGAYLAKNQINHTRQVNGY